MKDLARQVEQLKQIGAMGHTIGEQLDKLRTTAGAVSALLPWVPFDRDGLVRCYAMPVPAGAGYEAIRVNTYGHAVFPAEPYREFILPDIQQTIFVMGGRVSVTIAGDDGVVTGTHNLLTGDVLRIPQGAWVRLVYDAADCIFRQVPAIAGHQDMKLR